MSLRAVVLGMTLMGLSPKAKSFIGRKIKTLITKEKMAPRQAVATAFAMAKKKGYAVPVGGKKRRGGKRRKK